MNSDLVRPEGSSLRSVAKDKGRRRAPPAARAFIALAATLLLLLYLLPLWRISLTAPQYPEGLAMEIRLTTIAGAQPNHLRNINNLNRYIGMRPIEPDAFPELKYMPWAVAGLTISGLVAAALGRRSLIYGWSALLLLGGVIGVADMWRWGYVYGHDLDPTAIIKVPGMAYQPPLIGTKQLLNFRASSWPASGGCIAIVSALLAVTGVGVTVRRRRLRTAVAGESGVAAGRNLAAATVVAVVLAIPTERGEAQRTLHVGAAREFRTVTAAVGAARDGDTVLVGPGVYREPTIRVGKRITLLGEKFPVLDGACERQILMVTADDVTVRGLRLRNVGRSNVRDLAAIRVEGANDCTIAGNMIENAFFGIYLARSSGCVVEHNVLRGSAAAGLRVGERDPHSHEARPGARASGNGIHLWASRSVTIKGNHISGHRDGIYLEFAHDSEISENISTVNERYGLHFMYSDGSRYYRNVFRRNGAGVAVMYTKGVVVEGNRFEDNPGAAAYGLLLKEIYDADLRENFFGRNSVALLADGATRLIATKNTFLANGWAVKLMASTGDSRFTGNSFVGNTFDVATNSRGTSAVFSGNYWDRYRGYDLDRDGFGDAPHRPVRLFSAFVAENEAAIVLSRALLVDVLDLAEQLVPALTPPELIDRRPAMRRRP